MGGVGLEREGATIGGQTAVLESELKAGGGGGGAYGCQRGIRLPRLSLAKKRRAGRREAMPISAGLVVRWRYFSSVVFRRQGAGAGKPGD